MALSLFAVLVGAAASAPTLRPVALGSAGPGFLSAPAGYCGRSNRAASTVVALRGRQPWNRSMASCAPLEQPRFPARRRGAHQRAFRRDLHGATDLWLHSVPKSIAQGPESQPRALRMVEGQAFLANLHPERLDAWTSSNGSFAHGLVR